MSKWINSNIINNVGAKPNLKDDFYQNINYEWFKEVKLEPGKNSNSSFNEVDNILEDQLKELIINNKDDDHDSKLIQHYFKLLNNWEIRNSYDYHQLKIHLDVIDNIKSINELSEYILSDECYIHGLNIMRYDLGLDFKDSDSYNVCIVPTVLQLGDSDEYKNMTSNGERIKKYNDKLTFHVFEKFGYKKERIQEIIDNRFKFEKMIAPHIFSNEESSKSDYLKKIYNPVTLEELNNICKNYPIVEWLKTRKVAHSKLINLSEPEWLKKLDEFYIKDNLKIIKDYLIARVGNRFNPYLGEETFRFIQNLNNEYYGAQGLEKDEIIFMRYVINDYSPIISQLYIKKYVDKELKEKLTNLIQSIIDEYRIMLSENKWLSKDTINKAIEKLDNIKIRAAYPDKWDNFDDFEIIENESAYDYSIRYSEYYNQKFILDKINTKKDKEKWIDNIVVANAYYSVMQNSIIMIAGLFNGFFYNKDMIIEELLGSVGCVIAHEISHAFDINGAQFDKNGNFNNWWKEEDLEEFNKKTEKLIKYLDSFSFVENENYKGILVYKEMSADILAMKCILRLAKKIKDFNYDKFFKKYATLWKFVYTKDSMDSYLKTACHPLLLLRVNAVLQQYEEFYKEYDIKENNNMYLKEENRINIW